MRDYNLFRRVSDLINCLRTLLFVLQRPGMSMINVNLWAASLRIDYLKAWPRVLSERRVRRAPAHLTRLRGIN